MKTGKNGPPYVKLLSITNETEASADFTASRTKSLSTLPPQGNIPALVSLDNSQNDNPTSTSTGPPTKSAVNLAGLSTNDTQTSQSLNNLVKLAPYMLALLGLNALLLLVLAGMAIAFCLRRNKGDSMKGAARYQPVHLPPRKDDVSYGYQDEPTLYGGTRYDA